MKSLPHDNSAISDLVIIAVAIVALVVVVGVILGGIVLSAGFFFGGLLGIGFGFIIFGFLLAVGWYFLKAAPILYVSIALFVIGMVLATLGALGVHF